MPRGISFLESLIKIHMIISEWEIEYWLFGKEMVIITLQQIISKMEMLTKLLIITILLILKVFGHSYITVTVSMTMRLLV